MRGVGWVCGRYYSTMCWARLVGRWGELVRVIMPELVELLLKTVERWCIGYVLWEPLPAVYCSEPEYAGTLGQWCSVARLVLGCDLLFLLLLAAGVGCLG